MPQGDPPTPGSPPGDRLFVGLRSGMQEPPGDAPDVSSDNQNDQLFMNLVRPGNKTVRYFCAPGGVEVFRNI